MLSNTTAISNSITELNFPKGTQASVTMNGPSLKVSFYDGSCKRVITIGSETLNTPITPVKTDYQKTYFSSQNQKTKLTPEQVAEIKALHPILRRNGNWTIREANFVLASQYNCSDKNVDAIMRGRTWPSIEPAKNIDGILKRMNESITAL